MNPYESSSRTFLDVDEDASRVLLSAAIQLDTFNKSQAKP